MQRSGGRRRWIADREGFPAERGAGRSRQRPSPRGNTRGSLETAPLASRRPALVAPDNGDFHGERGSVGVEEGGSLSSATASCGTLPAMTLQSSITLHAPAPESVRLIACSPPSWMVELCLREKGLPYAIDVLDFAKGEHRAPKMLAKNPRGTVPVLSDGEASVYETFAILEYLEWAYPEPALLPTTRVARARALSRLHESEALKSAGMAAFAYLMRNPGPEPDKLAPLRKALLDEIERWEQRCDGSAWISGESLGLADLSVFTYLATAAQLGLDLKAFPRLTAFVERMRQRPSVQTTWPALWQPSPHAHLA